MVRRPTEGEKTGREKKGKGRSKHVMNIFQLNEQTMDYRGKKVR